MGRTRAADKKKKQTAEWKPTAEPWVIDRAYPLFVKNRCVFTHQRSRKWKSGVNFASCFATDARISVLYLYGPTNDDRLQNAVDAQDGHLIVFVLPVDPDDLAAWDDWKNEEKKIGASGNTKEALQAEIDKTLALLPEEENGTFVRERRKHIAIIEAGEAAEARIASAQNAEAKVVSNFLPQQSVCGDHSDFLLGVIRREYPLGVEANAPSEAGAKMLLMKQLVRDAASHSESTAVRNCVGQMENVQLSLFAPPPDGPEQFCRELSEWCGNKMRDSGCFSIADFFDLIAKPPYGYYPCNYYAYIVARALSPYAKDPYLVYRGVAAFSFSDTNAEDFLRAPAGIVFFESAKQSEIRASIYEIFKIDGEKPYNNIHAEIVRAAIEYCGNNVHTPLSCADARWGEIFRSDGKLWCNRNFAEKYHGFLTDVPARKREVQTIDHIFDGQYPAGKLRLFYRFYHVKGGAVGWAWDGDDFRKRLEEYMATTVCRECGRPLRDPQKRYAADTYQASDGHVLRFTEKSTIGLNKKLLGRYQEEYFCIKCLCEVLDTTPEDLKEKEQRFKEQGCALF